MHRFTAVTNVVMWPKMLQKYALAQEFCEVMILPVEHLFYDFERLP